MQEIGLADRAGRGLPVRAGGHDGRGAVGILDAQLAAERAASCRSGRDRAAKPT